LDATGIKARSDFYFALSMCGFEQFVFFKTEQSTAH
jgi:hypothetical protein